MQLNLDALGQAITADPFKYNWKTCATYALGIGAGPSELQTLWEGHPDFTVVPSFAVVPSFEIVMSALADVKADFAKVVHGAQTIELFAPIPKKGVLHTTGKIAEIQDKGKGAVVIIDTETASADGTRLFSTQWMIFCRGQGGFGGERGVRPSMPEPKADAAPVFESRLQTQPNQSLLYRLSGDLNPLHVDPELAAKVGFPAPILHGLCTYGFATRAVIAGLCGGDASKLKRLSARFSDNVFPGDALTVRAIESTTPNTFLLEVTVDDRKVLTNGVVEIH